MCVGLFLYPWKQFLAQTSLAPLPGNEVEDTSSLGYLSILLVLRGGLKPAFLKAIFHQSLTEWLLED